MITIYSYGCTTCGVNGALIRKVKRNAMRVHHENIVIVDTKISKQGFKQHHKHLKSVNGIVDNYPTIVVQGNTVSLLSAWNI